MQSRTLKIAGLLIIVLLVLSRLATLDHLLPGFCVEDERWLEQGSTRMLRTLSFDPGTHKYPGLMFELNALAQAAVFATTQWKAILHIESPASLHHFIYNYQFDFATSILTGRILVLLLSLACVLVFFRMLRGRLDPLIILISALLMISAPAFQFGALFLKTDMLLLLGVLISLTGALSIAERGHTKDYALGALGLGICLSAKYHVLPVVPLLIAHRYRNLDSKFARSFLKPELWLMLALSIAVFFIGSPMSFLQPLKMVESLVLELALQNRANPLLLASSVHWWHRPLLFQLLAVLPLVLGLPLYILGIAGLGSLGQMQSRPALIVFSYPVSFTLFMVLVSRLGYPHLYLPLVPFACIAAGCLLVRFFKGKAGLKSATAVLVLCLVVIYNLALFKSFTKLEERVLVEGREFFEEKSEVYGRGVGFVPYVQNPAEVSATKPYLPQFMLTRDLLNEHKPAVIFIHHAFYQAYMNNPELKRDEAYLTYLELINGDAGYREQLVQYDSMDKRIYARLLPDLRGMRTSVFVREDLSE